MFYGRKVDAAQPQMVKELVADDYAVISTSRAGGKAPDLIVGKYGLTVLVEVKTPGREKAHQRTLTKQAEARAEWTGRGGLFIQATTKADVDAAFAVARMDRVLAVACG